LVQQTLVKPVTVNPDRSMKNEKENVFTVEYILSQRHVAFMSKRD
jgi:hypothetical protein